MSFLGQLIYNRYIAECKNHLLQPELMLMLSAGRLLQAAALGSEPACSHIVGVTIPLLIEAFNKHNQVISEWLLIYFSYYKYNFCQLVSWNGLFGYVVFMFVWGFMLISTLFLSYLGGRST